MLFRRLKDSSSTVKSYLFVKERELQCFYDGLSNSERNGLRCETQGCIKVLSSVYTLIALHSRLSTCIRFESFLLKCVKCKTVSMGEKFILFYGCLFVCIKTKPEGRAGIEWSVSDDKSVFLRRVFKKQEQMVSSSRTCSVFSRHLANKHRLKCISFLLDLIILIRGKRCGSLFVWRRMCNIVLVGQDWVGENIAASNEGWCISVQSQFFFIVW